MTQINTEKHNLLISEVNYIYNSLFGNNTKIKLPGIVVEQYIQANEKLLSRNDEYESINIKLIIMKKLDIEAIEIITRGINGSVLSKKFHILLFLLEVRADYYYYFTNEKNTFIKSIIIMGYHSLRSIYKYLIGLYLIRHYNVF